MRLLPLLHRAGLRKSGMEESMSEGYIDFENELVAKLAMMLRMDEDEIDIGNWKILFRKDRSGNVKPITMLSVSSMRKLRGKLP